MHIVCRKLLLERKLHVIILITQTPKIRKWLVVLCSTTAACANVQICEGAKRI